VDRGDTVVEEGRGEGGRGGFVGVFWDVMLINMGSRCKYIVARAGRAFSSISLSSCA